MKKNGMLNSDISRVLSYMGHTDTICVGDAGLPCPDEVERIDLALKFGTPSFMETLEEVLKDMKVEKIVLAEEMKDKNPEMLEKVSELFGLDQKDMNPEMLDKVGELFGLDQNDTGVKVEFVPHEELKKRTKDCKAVIRTGENSPYSNVILQSACIF